MKSEKDSKYQTYDMNSLGEYATPYTHRDAIVYTTSFETGSEAGFSIHSFFLIVNLNAFITLYWANKPSE